MSVALGEEMAYNRSIGARWRVLYNGIPGAAANECLVAANIAEQAESDFAMLGWHSEASGAGNVARRFRQRADRVPGVRRNKWRRK